MTFEDFIKNDLEQYELNLSDLLVNIAEGDIEGQKFLFNKLKEFDSKQIEN